MSITSIIRIIKTAATSLWRNRWLSLAATLVMFLTLVTIAFFISLFFVTNRTTKLLKEKVDLSVYFEDSASKDQIFAIQNMLSARADIKQVEYVSKEKALEEWRKRNQDNDKLKNIITEDDNPLPRSLEIRTENPEDLAQINNILTVADYRPLIKRISYERNKDLVDRLVKITAFIKMIGWNLSFLFILISILIIYNTIRLTIYARRDEIDIMKLVGASDWYVRGPFVSEGMAYGLIAGVLAIIFYLFGLRLAINSIEDYLGVANGYSNLGLSVSFVVTAQILIGLVLGFVCSTAAVRKHLR